ncbi:hypothetical protein [Streptomyces sp. A0592]|uniref:hypothetical protein n=1 Tax=Streptomyces sp. A0592 TaxID=2563099 RepID=UPI00109E72B9|nr:hypothetical protein [Streptomyces sp. A0592]THA86887.1 hypothetical protein E6U81_02065 [Streptomyces sp. A0592]
MTKSAVSVTGRVVVAGLLCAVLAGCGTTRAGQAAPPAGVPTAAPADCDLDVTTDEDPGGYAGPPTDEEVRGHAGPPTDEETGAYAGPPTDEDTGAPAGPPTDRETGSDAGPPTDGETANGGGPCGPADWFDMTRDFRAYHQGHRAARDQDVSVRETRVRKVRSVGEARITFSTRQVGKGAAEDARAIAAVFTQWRREVYGDHGTLTLRTAEREIVTEPW